METECPHCGFKEVVFNQYAGKVGICGKCGCKYVVGNKVERNGNLELSDVPNSGFRERIDAVDKSIPNITDDKEIVALKETALEIKAVVAERYLAVQAAAKHRIQKWFPFLLKPLARFFIERRVPNGEEMFLNQLLGRIENTLLAIENRTTEIEEERREREKRLLEIGKFKDSIRKTIERIKANRFLVPIDCKYFLYQEGEVVYYAEKNIDCKVPRQTKCEYYEDGRFVVTNMRIVYTTEQHMQTYSIKSIRDFKPCWSLDAGWISIATSDKRNESYKFDPGWYLTMLILFLSNDVFMERLITQDVDDSVAYVWNKIVATTSPLHSKLFDEKEDEEKRSQLEQKCGGELAADEIDILLESDEINGQMKSELEYLQGTIRYYYSTHSEVESAYRKYLRMRKTHGFSEILEKREMKENQQRRARWLMKA